MILRVLTRVLTPADAHDPLRRQFVKFWNLAHAMERTADVRLALWTASRPLRQVPTARGPIAILGWKGRTEPSFTAVPISAIQKDPDLIGQGSSEDVVLARKTLPDVVMTELSKRYAYKPALDRQENGWAFVGNEALPRTKPKFDSGIALLPPRTEPLRPGTQCVLLVDVDDTWAVLSERALRVYTVGAALDDGERVDFVQWKHGRRVVWALEMGPRISPSMLGRRYGKDAQERARDDAAAICVRCN